MNRKLAGFWIMFLAFALSIHGAELTVEFKCPSEHQFEIDGVRFILLKVNNKGGALTNIEKIDDVSLQTIDPVHTFESLAPATYMINAHTGPPEEINDGDRRSAFIDSRLATLEANSHETVTFVYEPPEPNAIEEFKGDAAFEGRLMNWRGEPLKNRHISAAVYVPLRGFVSVAMDTTDESGRFRLEGLRKGDSVMLKMRHEIIYNVDVDGGFKSVKLRPRPGEPAPSFLAVDLETSKSVSLGYFRGRILVLDIWATWCAPCQPKIEELNKVAAAHPEWSDRVAFVALSIDEDRDALERRVLEKGWTSAKNLYNPDAAARDAYAPASTGIPVQYIIGVDGRIAKTDAGDLEDAIEDLMLE